MNPIGPQATFQQITGVTAIGTNQATAFPLVNNALHEFTTVASGTGAVLPVPILPSQITVRNAGANALDIYPPSGGTINNGSANAATSLAAGSGLNFWASSLTNWYTK